MQKYGPEAGPVIATEFRQFSPMGTDHDFDVLTHETTSAHSGMALFVFALAFYVTILYIA